jgi:aminomethyltransferase
MRKTPLCSEHEAAGAKMVDFAGWYMPVQYKGIKEEHHAVRTAVGLFDVSHMGEIFVRGPKALESLQWMTTNDVSVLKKGEAQYSLFPNKTGGIVDDLIVYCIEPGEEYLLCVNASNVEKDYAFVCEQNRGADIKNESDEWAQIAVQGPRADELLDIIYGYEKAGLGSSASSGSSSAASSNQNLSNLLNANPGSRPISKMAAFTHQTLNFENSPTIVARTGYTGEKGAEIFVRPKVAAKLWQTLLAKGTTLGVAPIGLGARDSLRTEMKYSLYGHEIDDTTGPYEAGLGWVVKPKAKDFLSKNLILAAKDAGLKRKLVGLKLLDRGIPRQGMKILAPHFDNQAAPREIGVVTSGTQAPSTGESIGIAYVDREFSEVGCEIAVDVRGRAAKAQVVKTPFVTSGLNP